MNLDEISQTISYLIDEVSIKELEKGPRTHLGASEIGHKCERYLWLKFRFCDYKKHNGRMLRLFNRGHQEEEKIKFWLENIGCKFDSQQTSFKDHGNHFSGSCDGLIYLPTRFNYNELVLWECKTYGGEENDKKDFASLLKNGVREAKPQHFAQMMIYAYYLKTEYCLYTAIQKSTDNIHIELIKVDFETIGDLIERAKRIITSDTPLKPLSIDKTYFECKYCDMCKVCFFEKEINKCCRSCKNCIAIEGEKWRCKTHIFDLDKSQVIENYCDCWQSIYSKE